jgi:molybdate transport system regulatory protein
MRTIVISADTRKLGKTLLGAELTRRLSEHGLTVSGVKLSRGGHGPDSPSSSPGPPGSDTRRYSDAGAVNVLFYKYSSVDELKEFMRGRTFDTDILIIESNSALEVTVPDLHLHIASPEGIKPSAEGLGTRADLVTSGPLDSRRAKRLAGLVPAVLGIQGASSVTIGGKHWLNIQGEPLFGEGRMDLLKAVREHGSILQAAAATGIQYKRAWVMIHDAEDRIGARLVSSGRGGAGGGGTRISPLAEKLLDLWERSEREFEKMLGRLEV